MMRKFGIELEVIAPRAQAGNALAHASSVINGLGIACRVARYPDRNYTQWMCKPDISLRPQDRAVEVVSRTLPASPDSFAEVMRVVTALDAQGYTVNVSCGMHVHVNVADLPIRTRQLVALRYNRERDNYNAMMPASRRGGNDYCRWATDMDDCERAINAGRDDWRRNHGRHSEVVNTAFMYDSDARLEFRQAAGTCEAAKAVAWVRYLFEMVAEVDRRARGATFAQAVRGIFTAPVRPVPLNPLASVPRMHSNSDAARALRELCAHGVVTTAWAAQNGIVGPVMRRIIVGFRRHGAGLRTVSAAGGPEYHLVGVAAPCTPQQIFAPVAPQPVIVPTPVTVAPTPAVATTTAAELVRYDFFAGLSAESAAWVRSRRDTFAADNQP